MAAESFDKSMMELALRQARRAGVHGEVPVGAVIVRGSEVIATGYNLTRRLQDATMHAEMAALRAAARHLGHWHMQQCSMYVTLEPCTQCAGAILLARLGRLVFGAPEPKFGAVGSVNDLLRDERLNHRVEVASGLMAAECAELMQQFFRGLRRSPGD